MSDITKQFTAINPADVPSKVLRSGDKLPTVGLGTFGSDRFTHDEVAAAVKDAIRLGYRHIDCAAVYGNEKQIGQAIKEVIDEGVCTREELFITGKVWNDRHREVEKACQESLDDLQLSYLDMYLIHWPFPNYHAPGCDGDARNPDSKPFSVDEFMDTWKQCEALVDAGKVRNIGTSNMTIAKFEKTLPLMKILPAVNEMEMHPCFQQQELFDYCMKKQIQPIGFMPIGSPTRPERDIAEGDAVDIQTPEIQAIAKARGVHPAVICIKWAIKNGQVTIPFSVHPAEYLSNLQSSFTDPLTDEEFASIKNCECGSRLVKGQVFLWEGAKHWKDLWDEDGVIAQ
ncbi:aldo/keto reductase family protein [Saccharicrinis fermentans]|uniref:2,5-diketo-D-gluconic acid reductase A n=1 Tax=Saccharicrinis fermentans DSM 9555 = JCM 21142 TaxID=869213 RepID=W7YJQ3_9BACT|nr:aldo/keto reductase [Saccharicrinis fermentans]GAF04761.1 2,5-diketo-D-gluconic acid reductase A [Saccharicrinis fermentans DSM 9555 = JCM 21142]